MNRFFVAFIFLFPLVFAIENPFNLGSVVVVCGPNPPKNGFCDSLDKANAYLIGYTVKPGDSIDSVASYFGVSPKDITELNPGKPFEPGRFFYINAKKNAFTQSASLPAIAEALKSDKPLSPPQAFKLNLNPKYVREYKKLFGQIQSAVLKYCGERRVVNGVDAVALVAANIHWESGWGYGGNILAGCTSGVTEAQKHDDDFQIDCGARLVCRGLQGLGVYSDCKGLSGDVLAKCVLDIYVGTPAAKNYGNYVRIATAKKYAELA